MDGLETRELKYFVAIAEELHFGRAAERLGIAQPPLSRAIKQLEQRLGVMLIERTSRHNTLTPAGEVLLHEARKALEAVAAAARRTQRAGHEQPRLVLVMKAASDGGILQDILDTYAAEPDSIPVQLRVCGVGGQAAVLRDGRADVALLHLPWDDISGFDTEELLVEGAVAVLPAWHRLAGRTSLCMADLEGETLPRWPGKPGTGPEVEDSGQLMQLIAVGQAVAVLPSSAWQHLRRDLVAVPVLDGPITTVLIAWPERSRSRAVAAFVRVATRVAEQTVRHAGSA
ncbi:DNA-binding transcriptional LysR family regulator [Kibdelosporangium banguiense]|uniref:DNA-binding transcriptional LysR family regulator n=1 Tax=Kibdelosporangium banguiense TaxID=1365924 RepID=A0ABS4TKQ0_9PSEU|nr:LysR family transcriptional regulator [Kibdelosporangium banguiense]MBP2324549.1 DNA-binding transcriptional LysR family regulator [Kibdelosporangium banguiense]